MPSASRTSSVPSQLAKRASPVTPVVVPVAGVIVVVLAAGWFVLMRPLWQQYRSLPDPAVNEAAKSAITQQIKVLNDLKAEYAKLTATDFTRLDLFLPKGRDLPTLLAQLEGLAEFAGFDIESLGIADVPQGMRESRIIRDAQGEVVGVDLAESEPTGPSLQELQLTLTLSPGTYEQIKGFIAATEQSLRVLTLTSLTFTNKSGEGNNGFSLNFRSPYLK